MAILLIKGHPLRYIGLSSDVKPVIDSEAYLEAEFIETDTKLIYVYTGETWVEKTATFIPAKGYVWNSVAMAWEAESTTRVVPVTGTFYPTTQEVSQDPLATWVSGSLTLTSATTAYLIPAVEQAARRQLILYNGSDTNMFIGSSAVTVATGILLATGATMMIDAGAGLYAICASAGKVLNYLEGK